MANVNYAALKQVTGRQECKVVIAPNLDVALTMIEDIAIMNGNKPEKKEVLVNRLVEEYVNDVITKMNVMDIANYTQLTKKVDVTAQELAEKVIPVKLMNNSTKRRESEVEA